MSSEKERLQILDLIESGQISAEEGVRLLKTLGSATHQPGIAPILPDTQIDEPVETTEWQVEPTADTPEVLVTPRILSDDMPTGSNNIANQVSSGLDEGLQEENPADGLPPDALRWKSWWMIPLWIGVAITVSGGFLMYSAMEKSGIGLSFLCAGVPFFIGLVLMIFAWQSRTAPWLHLRVQQKPGERPQRIAFSFPIPVRPTVWFLRIFGSNVKELENVSLDEMLLAVGDATSPDNPIYIQVDEGDEGEKVEIYIG